MSRIRNQGAALAVLMILASCTTSDSPTAGPPSTTSVTPSTTTATPDHTVVAGTHLDGPGRWAQTAVGDPKAPLAVFDVTAGYQARESFIWVQDELGLQDHQGIILYQAPTRVFSDACDIKAPSPRLGPTVADLAGALVAQRHTTTTSPAPVTLGAYSGLYLELSIASGLDLKACGADDGMVLWQAGDADEGHVIEFPATERYWILDVKGHRVVVSATIPVGAARASVKRVTDVAEGVTFVSAAP